MTNALRAGLTLALVAAATPVAAHASGAGAALGGSLASMKRQHGVARQANYTFLASSAQVAAFVAEGRLEPIVGNGDFVVSAQVAHPYGRPEVGMLLERLGAQYRAATGRSLVVTSLVRPTTEQPSNAHRLSVHPAGMAVDLRVPSNATDRKWLEQALLKLERAGVLDVTREKRPPHYHVAVFPAEYRAYVQRDETPDRAVKASLDAPSLASAPAAAAVPVTPPAPQPIATTVSAARVADPSPSPAVPAAVVIAIAGLLAGVAFVRTRVASRA